MNTKNFSKLNRRHWLQLSAGALLGTGLWPGCARWSEHGRGGEFSFVVLNDPHYSTPRCPAWFERVRSSVLSLQPKPEFCLVVGDLAQEGKPTELGGMRDVLKSFGLEFFTVMGNHDWTTPTDGAAYAQLFPDRLNYRFEHRGWQFIGLDSTQGRDYQQTRIQPATLNWLDSHLPRLQPAAPTVLFTHFPLGAGVSYRPLNADSLLQRFEAFNLVSVFDGHFHGFTERRMGRTVLTTNRCCAISRENFDGTKEKGYFLCTARDGQISRKFIEVQPA